MPRSAGRCNPLQPILWFRTVERAPSRDGVQAGSRRRTMSTPSDDEDFIEVEEVTVEETSDGEGGEYTAGDYPEGDVRETRTEGSGYTSGDYPEGDER